MKHVKLEDVTGKPRERKAYVADDAVNEPQLIGKPKSPEQLLDQYANEATHAIMACFTVAGLFVINLFLGQVAGDAVPFVFIAGEAESTASLIIMALLMAACGVFMIRRSKEAAILAFAGYGLQSLWISWLLWDYSGADFPFWKTVLVRAILIGVLARGFHGISRYKKLEPEVKMQTEGKRAGV